MKKILFLSVVFFAFLFSVSVKAQDTAKKLKLSADVRFRTELDRNSMKTSGELRNDRDRFRYRMRFGFKYMLNDMFEFGARIRSGNPLNQQSPHVTLGKEFHSDAFSIDKAYIKTKFSNGLWLWGGKNSMPFWEQNELLWDGDVNPEGIAMGGKFAIGENAKLVPVIGYFIAGHAGKSFGDDNTLTLAQLKYDSKLGSNNLVLSSGIILGNDIPNKPDGTHTFVQDYKIWATSLQFKLKNVGLTFGVDYFKNLQDYSGNDNIADVFEDQTAGYVASLKYSINKFQLGYYYAHIEKYAVVDFLAQDDWMRWGNSNYTRSSNFGGHEFRVKYKFTNKFNTVLRAYFIEGLKSTTENLETGTRIRLDFNIKF